MVRVGVDALDSLVFVYLFISFLKKYLKVLNIEIKFNMMIIIIN